MDKVTNRRKNENTMKTLRGQLLAVFIAAAQSLFVFSLIYTILSDNHIFRRSFNGTEIEQLQPQKHYTSNAFT
jgi:hypothetical protein